MLEFVIIYFGTNLLSFLLFRSQITFTMQSLYDEIKREEPDLAEQMSFEDYLKIFMLLCALFLFPILAIGVILEIWENFKNN